MLPGLRNTAGVLFTTVAAPAATSNLIGGVALSITGAVHITTTPSTLFVNGYMVSPTGQLVIAPAGATVGHLGGLPRTITGALVTQLNATPLDTDPFVGGLRVGAGGVFITDATPTGFSAFSTGFDDGFS